MKRLIMLATTVCVFLSMSVVSNCAIHETAKNSVYLPNNSWVISRLEASFESAGRNPAEGWKDKVMISYECVDTGMPESGEMSDIFKKTKAVGLGIPMMADMWGPESLSATVEFKEPIDAQAVMFAQGSPAEALKASLCLSNLGSGGAYEKEITKMDSEKHNTPNGFTFDEHTKIYSAGMGTYTWGYILKDKDNKKLFWCCHEAGAYKEGKFHDLKLVLEAYKQYKLAMKDLDAGGHYYANWL